MTTDLLTRPGARLWTPGDVEILDDATRREFLAGLLAAGLLAACGGDGTDESNGGAATPEAPATRTFVDVAGRSIDVPDRPTRIVAIHDINAGVQLLSLGAPVIGIATRDTGAREDVTRYFDLDGIAEVGLTYEPNIEAIAALEPDLIVGEGFDGAGMEQFMEDNVQAALERIAPVVYIDTFRPVEGVMADFAELVGGSATETVDDQASEFEEVLEELRGVLGDRWMDVTAANVSSGDPHVVNGARATVHNDILTRLGVTWALVVEEADSDDNGGFLELGGERLDTLESDLLVVTTAFDQRILDVALYQNLAVVKAGQVVTIDEPSSGTHWRNYIAAARDLLAQLEAIDLDVTLV